MRLGGVSAVDTSKCAQTGHSARGAVEKAGEKQRKE